MHCGKPRALISIFSSKNLFKIEEIIKEMRTHDLPAHMYQELNETFQFDLFKAMKENPTADITNIALGVFPSVREENPSAELLEKETFHDVDELM